MVAMTSASEQPERSRHAARKAGFLLRCYLFVVAMTISIDWFYPTGTLFREFGARPATPLLTIGGFAALLLVPRRGASARRQERVVAGFFSVLLLLGAAAFALNTLAGWSGSSSERNPVLQFLAQSAMGVVAGIAVLGNARLAARYDLVLPLRRAIPVVAAIHLLVWYLEYVNVLTEDGLLGMFKAPQGAVDRASGLHTEPSYYGAMAGLFSFALLLLPVRGFRRLVNICLAAGLVATSIVVTAKTFVAVAGAQALYLVLGRRYSGHVRIYALISVLAVGGIMYTYTRDYAALSVEENLSTAMRFGSTHLGLNVAAAGYGVPGIGIGQFHFFYRREFAPDYLLLSREAMEQMEPDAYQRASTFNLYVRVLLETGALGFALLLYAMTSILRTDLPKRAFFLLPMFVGAAGFLLTQDTYFYPPLVFAASMILGTRADSRARKRLLTGTRSVPAASSHAAALGAERKYA